jgi:hypothetical protein
VPAQDCFRCDDGANIGERLPAQDLAFDCQSPALVVIQQNPLFAQLFTQNAILGEQIFKDILLMLIDPASQNKEQYLPGLQNKFHGTPDTCD